MLDHLAFNVSWRRVTGRLSTGIWISDAKASVLSVLCIPLLDHCYPGALRSTNSHTLHNHCGIVCKLHYSSFFCQLYLEDYVLKTSKIVQQ